MRCEIPLVEVQVRVIVAFVAKAKHHFKVEKNLVNDRTLTSVRLLNEEEHIHEVARLMSGEEISDAAILNAKNLMNS